MDLLRNNVLKEKMCQMYVSWQDQKTYIRDQKMYIRKKL